MCISITKCVICNCSTLNKLIIIDNNNNNNNNNN